MIKDFYDWVEGNLETFAFVFLGVFSYVLRKLEKLNIKSFCIVLGGGFIMALFVGPWGIEIFHLDTKKEMCAFLWFLGYVSNYVLDFIDKNFTLFLTQYTNFRFKFFVKNEDEPKN